MRKLARFWQALESVPGPAAVAAEWRRLLGPEHDLVQGFLRPCERLAESYPCPDPKNAGTLHKVVVHGPDHIVGVCPDGCAPVRLSREDIVVWELHHAALGRAAAEAFGLRYEGTSVDSLAKTAQIGTYRPYAGLRFPVYLTIRMEPAEFRQVVDGLLARSSSPFILLTPTRELCKPACEELLTRGKACFVPLCEVLVLDERGRLLLGENLSFEGVLADFRAAVLPLAEDQSGMVFFPTPPDVRWEDVTIRFRDSHTVSVKVGDVSQVCHYTKMGMADGRNGNPTKQWELLLMFADEGGIIDWSSRKADRKRQKQREILADDLRRFFRIEGDPIATEGNGWRTHFSVEPRT